MCGVATADTSGAEAIVGSANLNDRSLLGDRDAEVSVGVKGPFVKALRAREIRRWGTPKCL